MMPSIYIVDDDAATRHAMRQLLEGAGFRVKTFADGRAFLDACEEGCAGCVILDISMPDMTGLEVQAELNARGLQIPVLFLTGQGDIPMAVRAVQAGAEDFFEKPVQGSALIDRVSQVLAQEEERRQLQEHAREIQERHGRLSPRERQVMALVVSGLSSKEIARKLSLSPRTVEAHRANVMYKMGAASLVDLVRMADRCES